jgi:hypothetical protein
MDYVEHFLVEVRMKSTMEFLGVTSRTEVVRLNAGGSLLRLLKVVEISE